MVDLSSLAHSLPVEHIFFISLIDKEKVTELLYNQIPRVLRFAWGHNSSSCYISGKNLSFAFFGKSLNRFISYKLFIRNRSSERRQLLRLANSGFVPTAIESVYLPSWHFQLGFAWGKSYLVKTLFSELLYHWPFCLNFVGRVSHTSALPLVVLRLFRFPGIVCSRNLSLPLLFLFGLLWACKISFQIVLVLLLLNLKLLPLRLSLLRSIASLFILGLSFIFNTSKTEILWVLNELRVSHSLNLLLCGATLICSINCVLLRNRSGILGDCYNLANAEFLQLADFFSFVIGFKKPSVELVTEVWLNLSGPESRAW